MRFTLLLLLGFTFAASAQRSDFAQTNFSAADSLALLYKGESLENLPVLTHKLTANLNTDVEKFRSIYTWVGTNIENDYDSYLKTSKKRKKLAADRDAYMEWNNSFTPRVIENLIEHKKTACTGYAYLTREMATLAGLNCEIINGYGRTPNLMLQPESQANHSWNKIELNGKWYLCDATWSAGRIIFEDDRTKFENDYHDGYFLADPDLFIKNHYPLELNASLLNEPPTFIEFTEGPVVYKEAFAFPIVPVSPLKMHLTILKNESVNFTLQVPENFKSENVYLVLNRGGSDQVIHPETSQNERTLSLVQTFEKTGVYDVHIMSDSDFIATYVVRVKRK